MYPSGRGLQAWNSLKTFTHIMLAVADTEPIDHKLIAELEGRFIQLKLSWRQFQEAISEEEVDKILRQVFGDDYDK